MTASSPHLHGDLGRHRKTTRFRWKRHRADPLGRDIQGRLAVLTAGITRLDLDVAAFAADVRQENTGTGRPVAYLAHNRAGTG